MKRIQSRLQGLLILGLSIALPSGAFASITNTATATYQDLAGTPYTATSLQVVILTPPVVTAPANLTLDVGVAMTAVQVAATNSPTSFTLAGGPTGISINNSGLITGTPSAGSAGTYTATITANNPAGPGTATFTITVHGAATITLTKTADVTRAISGDTVTFAIAYQNTGAGTASNLVITDAIPAGSTLKAGSITSGGTFAAGTITWTIPSVISGGSGNVSFKVTVN